MKGLLMLVVFAAVLLGSIVALVDDRIGLALVGVLVMNVVVAVAMLIRKEPSASACRMDVRASVAVVALAAVVMVPLAGCTKAQQDNAYAIAQEINKYAPTVEAALEGTAATVAAADPAISAAIMAGVVAFDTLKVTFNAALNAYLANPSAGALADLQAAINAIEANLNTASANALRIVNPTSAALAVGLLKSVLTVASYVFGLISQTETQAQIDALHGTIQITRLRPYMDEAQLRSFAREEGAPRILAGVYVDQAFDRAAAEGF